ncbi:MAG: FG-GAP-like repeat-containing protein [Saprospiraceae bacterium]
MTRCIFFIYIILIANTGLAQVFQERGHEMGINHTTYAPNMMSGGISIIDFNNDGLEDIYFTGGKYPDHMYMNLGDGTFEDVTTELGLDIISERYTVGVVAGDLDNDGFTDLFITTYLGESNICLKNLKGKFFEDVTEGSGLFGTKWSTSVTMADTDLDGDLDIYVSNFIDFSEPPFFRNITEVEPNFFFENLGNWNFESKIDFFTKNIDGCTLVSCFTDIDNDMDPDLFVVNDFGSLYTPNQLYINKENGNFFQEYSKEYNVNKQMDGMGIAIGDIDENGYLDYYISNIGDNVFYLGGYFGPEFTDVSHIYNINDGKGYSWGTFFADVDNDSYLDLYVAKGSISDYDDPQLNRLYHFDHGIDDFIDISAQSGLNDEHKARGAVYADLNNDGLLDIIVNNVRISEDNDEKALIYINKGNQDNNYVKLKLEGTDANSSAFGAFVELYSKGRRFIREVSGGSSYLSNNSTIVHFGLASSSIDSLVVSWPGGGKQSFKELAPNNFYFLKEGDNIILYDLSLTTSDEIGNTGSIEKLKKFSVIPNVPGNYIFVTPMERGAEDVTIDLIHPLGHRLMSYNRKLLTGEDLKIDVSSYATGTYFIRIRNNKYSQIEKICIVK